MKPKDEYYQIKISGEVRGTFSSEVWAQMEFLDCCARDDRDLVELVFVQVLETNATTLIGGRNG